MSIERILSYRNIAVVGISDNPERPSHSVSSFMEAHGYNIIPVNPNLEEWEGKKCYPDLLSIPLKVDVVDIFRRSEAVPPIVDEAIKIKAKAVWMQEGIVNEEAAAKAREADIEVVMDRCMKKEYQIQKKKRVTIGLIQSRVSEDIKENMEKTAERIKDAAEKGAQIICLQELYRTKYFPREEKKDATELAETIPGDSTGIFSSLAEELGVVIIVPVFEKARDGNYYNSAAVIDSDGKLMNTYRKIHIPHDPFFYEKDYFKEGDLGYCVYKTGYASFSVLICYDQWFPEAARIAALKGADILFYPTAIGWIKDDIPAEDDWHDAWETIQRSHAIANGVHVAAVNRVGEEGELRFWGSSFVCDSFGKVLKRASEDKEDVIIAELDLSKNKRIQESWGFLRNRRPDTYRSLSSG